MFGVRHDCHTLVILLNWTDWKIRSFKDDLACVSGSMLEIEPATEVNEKWIFAYESYAKFPLVRNKYPCLLR